ncbi:DUF1294 domain-containing protein [Acinetobacter apis]|uniref:Cold shock protein, CspA family n=1 Tax=Acinetobacter apis TaxID=1229165 RepID=A0A217EGU4_9GAMM|nr:cold-shock protein [Acinetobacter apis]SNQ29723.1 hypothetical protein SAMN05444584_1688 [Acinetobacter apis]
MRDQGRLIQWVEDEQSGLIQPNDSSKQPVYLSLKDFAKRGPRPIVGCALDYQVRIDEKGRFRASDVMYLTAKQSTAHQRTHLYRAAKQQNTSSSRLAPSTIAIIIYWIVILVLNSMGQLPNIWFSILFMAQIVIYFLSKPLVQHPVWSLSPRSIFIFVFSVFGGWPILVLMQNKLRLNTQSQPFKTLYIGTIALNILCTLWIVGATYPF